jgi:CRP-like cAMP-binding protein
VDQLSLITTGRIALQAHARGSIVQVGLLGAGDLFGEFDAHADIPETLKHVAIDDTIVRVVAKSVLRSEIHSHRDLAAQMLFVYTRAISEKVRMANAVATELAANAGDARTVVLKRASERPAHLSREEVAWVEVLGVPESHATGEVIVEEGDTTQGFYVIDTGEVEVRKRLRDRQQPLAHLGKHDLFGQMSFIDGKPRSASVVAVTPVRCHRVEPAALDRALEMSFAVGFKFLGTMRTVLTRMFADTVHRIVVLRGAGA